MLSKREKVLINILFWVIILTGAWLFYYFKDSEYSDLSQNIDLLEEQIKKYSIKLPTEEELKIKKEVLFSELDKEKSRFYQPDEIDLNLFSNIIWDLLVKNGITVEKYAPVEENSESLIEFIIKCDAYSFFSFLRQVSEAEKYWGIDYLSIRSPSMSGTLDITFRIKYEQYVSEDS